MCYEKVGIHQQCDLAHHRRQPNNPSRAIAEPWPCPKPPDPASALAQGPDTKVQQNQAQRVVWCQKPTSSGEAEGRGTAIQGSGHCTCSSSRDLKQQIGTPTRGAPTTACQATDVDATTRFARAWEQERERPADAGLGFRVKDHTDGSFFHPSDQALIVEVVKKGKQDSLKGRFAAGTARPISTSLRFEHTKKSQACFSHGHHQRRIPHKSSGGCTSPCK